MLRVMRYDPLPPHAVMVSIGSHSLTDDWPGYWRSQTAVTMDRADSYREATLSGAERQRIGQLATPGVSRTRHGGRKRCATRVRRARACACGCGVLFVPRTDTQRFASFACRCVWQSSEAGRAVNAASHRDWTARKRERLKAARADRRNRMLEGGAV